jgi:hypothetical protein
MTRPRGNTKRPERWIDGQSMTNATPLRAFVTTADYCGSFKAV